MGMFGDVGALPPLRHIPVVCFEALVVHPGQGRELLGMEIKVLVPKKCPFWHISMG